MKAKVTVEILGLLPIPVKAVSIIDFGENSNIFGRIYDTHKYFERKYGVSYEQITILKVNYLD